MVGIGIGEGKSDGNAQFRTTNVGGKSFTVLALAKDKHPEPKVEGDSIIVNEQVIRFDGKRIVFVK